MLTLRLDLVPKFRAWYPAVRPFSTRRSKTISKHTVLLNDEWMDWIKSLNDPSVWSYLFNQKQAGVFYPSYEEGKPGHLQCEGFFGNALKLRRKVGIWWEIKTLDPRSGPPYGMTHKTNPEYVHRLTAQRLWRLISLPPRGIREAFIPIVSDVPLFIHNKWLETYKPLPFI